MPGRCGARRSRSRIDDIVTIVVAEILSAVASGATDFFAQDFRAKPDHRRHGHSCRRQQIRQSALCRRRSGAGRHRVHLAQHDLHHHHLRARRRSHFERNSGGRRNQEHRRQFRKTDHHRPRLRPPCRRHLNQHDHLHAGGRPAGQGHRQGRSRRRRFAVRISCTVCCSACCPSKCIPISISHRGARFSVRRRHSWRRSR